MAHACLPGLTREKIIELAAQEGLVCEERDLSMTQMYTADELFTTGTMGALSWVKEVDGRTIGDGKKGVVVCRLQDAYKQCVSELSVQVV